MKVQITYEVELTETAYDLESGHTLEDYSTDALRMRARDAIRETYRRDLLRLIGYNAGEIEGLVNAPKVIKFKKAAN